VKCVTADIDVVDSVCTDSYAANTKAEASMDREGPPNQKTMHLKCIVHKTHGVAGRTFSILEDATTGMLHVSLALAGAFLVCSRYIASCSCDVCVCLGLHHIVASLDVCVLCDTQTQLPTSAWGQHITMRTLLETFQLLGFLPYFPSFLVEHELTYFVASYGWLSLRAQRLRV
jgi:hypothetical protein